MEWSIFVLIKNGITDGKKSRLGTTVYLWVGLAFFNSPFCLLCSTSQEYRTSGVLTQNIDKNCPINHHCYILTSITRCRALNYSKLIELTKFQASFKSADSKSTINTSEKQKFSGLVNPFEFGFRRRVDQWFIIARRARYVALSLFQQKKVKPDFDSL